MLEVCSSELYVSLEGKVSIQRRIYQAGADLRPVPLSSLPSASFASRYRVYVVTQFLPRCKPCSRAPLECHTPLFSIPPLWNVILPCFNPPLWNVILPFFNPPACPAAAAEVPRLHAAVAEHAALSLKQHTEINKQRYKHIHDAKYITYIQKTRSPVTGAVCGARGPGDRGPGPRPRPAVGNLRPFSHLRFSYLDLSR